MKKASFVLVVLIVLSLIISTCAYGESTVKGFKSEEEFNSPIKTITSTVKEIEYVAKESSKDVTEEGEDFNIPKESDIDKIAKVLNNLQILKGTEKGFELDRGLTRVESAVIITLLSGDAYYEKSTEKKNHGFTDVPAWANTYVGHLKMMGAINGISATEFGSNNSIPANQFVTMVLRLLGYNDKEGEFVWNKSLDKAVEIGLLDKYNKERIESSKDFLRGDMALITYNALFQVPKGKDRMLINYTTNTQTGKGISSIFSIETSEEDRTELARTDRKEGELIYKDDIVKFKAIEENIIQSVKNVNNMYRFYYGDKEYKIRPLSIDYVSSVRPPNLYFTEIGSELVYKNEVILKSTVPLDFWLYNNKLVPSSDYSWRSHLGLLVIKHLYVSENDIDNLDQMRVSGGPMDEYNHVNTLFELKYPGKESKKYYILYDENNINVKIEDYKSR